MLALRIRFLDVHDLLQVVVMLSLDAIFNNIWILFIIFTFVYPQLQKSALLRNRRLELERLGKKRGSNVITLIHRQETISFLGVPISRYIDIDDSEEVLRAIRLTPDDTPIDIIIHTPGGIALAATQIALALEAHPARKTVIIPHYAMSGGTLIALAADEIMMDPHAVMGPVDPQLGDQQGMYAASSILKVVETKKTDELDDRTLYLAEESRKAIAQIEKLVRKLVKDIHDGERTEEIVRELVSGKYTHDFPVTAEEACELLGECVNRELPREVYSLMSLYKMENRPRRPSVEFVPLSSR
jgi:ClpP class serine protease